MLRKKRSRLRGFIGMCMDPKDIELLSEGKEEVPPEQQDRSPRLDQDPAEPPHIKEEQEEVWTSQEGEELQGLQEADVSRFSEDDDDEEKPQSSQLHPAEQMEAEADGEDCGGPEPARTLGPGFQPGYPGGKPFSCSLACQGSTQKAQLGLRTLRGEKPPSCSVRSKTCWRSGALTQHVASHAAVEPLCCSNCGKTFRRTSQLKIHRCFSESSPSDRSDRHKTAQRCSECDATFPNNYLLMTHVRMHKGKKLFTCTVCGAKRHFSSHLEIHMRTHTGERPYSCSVCGKHFSQKGIVKQHMAVHSGVKPFSCSDCGRRFCWQFQVKRHKCPAVSSQQRGSDSVGFFNPFRLLKAPAVEAAGPSVHTDESIDVDFWKDTRQHQSGFTYQKTSVTASVKNGLPPGHKPFSCSNQQRPNLANTAATTATRAGTGGFKKKKGHDQLPGHDSDISRSSAGQTYKKSPNKPLSCLFCAKEFTTGGSLTRHMAVHTGLNLLTCIVCETSFSLKTELLTHCCESSQLHPSQPVEQTANKWFRCSRCGKGFGRKQHLQLHMRNHAGEKPRSCSDCGKTSPRLRHTGEKPFHCSVCNANFIDGETLVKHMRIHTRHTQFSCSVCDKEFTWRRSLTRHMEVHATQRLYSCSSCQRVFTQVQQLRQHPCVSESSQLHQTQEGGRIEHRVSSSAGQDSEPEVISTGNPPHHLTPEGSITQHVNLQGGAKQEDPAEPPHIKEEQEEVWTSQEGEELQGLEKDDVRRFTVTPVPVKSEDDDDEEKPQSSQLHPAEQMEAEADGEDCGGPEPARTSGPDTDDSVDSDFWKETRERPAGFNCWRNKGVDWSGSDEKLPESLEPDSDKSLDNDLWKKAHNSGKRAHSCSECGKRFFHVHHLKNHTRFHVRQREPFFCSVCGQKCLYRSLLKIHMRTHTGEKPFICPACGKKYAHKASMQSHMSVHLVEKRYNCSLCHKSFAWFTELKYHQCVDPRTLPEALPVSSAAHHMVD